MAGGIKIVCGPVAAVSCPIVGAAQSVGADADMIGVAGAGAGAGGLLTPGGYGAGAMPPFSRQRSLSVGSMPGAYAPGAGGALGVGGVGGGGWIVDPVARKYMASERVLTDGQENQFRSREMRDELNLSGPQDVEEDGEADEKAKHLSSARWGNAMRVWSRSRQMDAVLYFSARDITSHPRCPSQ